MTNARSHRWQTALWAGVGLALVGLLWLLGPVLSPFLLGLVLAYMCEPLVGRLCARRLPRPLAVVLVILFVLGCLVGLVLILVPLVQTEVSMLVERLPGYFARINTELSPWLQKRLGIALQLDTETLRKLLLKHWSSAQDVFALILDYLGSSGVALMSLAANALLMPVVMFYLMRDWPQLRERLFASIPRPWLDNATRLLGEVDAVLAEFMRGQLLVMISLALFYSVGLWLAGLPYALPVGLLTGLLVFIPYVGFATGLVLALLVAVLQFQGWPPLISVAVVFGLGQLLESFLLTPWLVGERIGLHPLAVIFALMAFSQLFGFVGVLVALPASAALLVGLREVRRHYLASSFYRGPGPDVIQP